MSPRQVSGGAGVTLPKMALLQGRTPMQDKDEGDDPDKDGYTRFLTASGIDSSTTCNFCRKGPNDCGQTETSTTTQRVWVRE